MNTPLKISHADVNWDDAIEKALENHLHHIRAHHHLVWPTIIDQDINFFDTAPVLLEQPALTASEQEWQMYDADAEERFSEWQVDRLRLDYEIPYFHLTSLFVHICSSTEGWLSSLCDLLAAYHGTQLTHRDIKRGWALSAQLRFLESVLHLDLVLPPDLIQRVRGRLAIRNAIVHTSPLFRYSSVWAHEEYPKQSVLVADKAFSPSRDGKLRFNEAYLLQAFDDSIAFSRAITEAI